jgi:P27 family predicted phage terminase small subunit
MARPRKKTPEIEKIQGYPSRRRGKTNAEIAALERDAAAAKPADAEKRPPRVPPAPDWLPEGGRKLWNVLASDLVRRQIVKTAGEWQEFGRYIHHCWMWGRLQAELVTPTGRLRTTYTTTTAAGGKRRYANPAFGQMLQLEMKLKDYEDRYGLNPQARTALLTRIAGIGAGGKKPPYDGEAPAPAGDAAAPAGGPKPGSPLGILNTGKRLN